MGEVEVDPDAEIRCLVADPQSEIACDRLVRMVLKP
jgi:hypothetical protein